MAKGLYPGLAGDAVSRLPDVGSRFSPQELHRRDELHRLQPIIISMNDFL